MKKIKIGFICVHNSCRSIMAEAICKNKYSDMFEVYSGGTELSVVKQDALDCLKRNYNIEGEFRSKLVDELPKLDILVTMGCNVNCPYHPADVRLDFGVGDPSGLDTTIFDLTAKLIEVKIDNLVLELKNKELMEEK